MDTKKVKDWVLDLLFPKFCLGCQQEGTYLCDNCRAVLDISQYDYCLCERNPTCFYQQQKIGKCPKCQYKNLSGLYFALPYKENKLTHKLIHQFKYKPYLKNLAKTLASLVIEHFILTGKNGDDIWENSAIVPVPLDITKLRSRGYNQSGELAKELSIASESPVLPDVLIKTKATKPQMELSKNERQKNLAGVFAIKNCQAIAGKKIFLIDDVYTTGSTMEECASILKAAGAKSVWGICIARESLQ